MTVVRPELHDRIVRTWDEAPGVPVRGVVIVLPGRGETPEVYERLGRRLAGDSYRVHAVTAPSEDAKIALEDLAHLLDHDGSAADGLPRAVIGSDTGALFAARAAALGHLPRVDALVLAGLPLGPGVRRATDWESELADRTSCPTHRRRITAAGVTAGALYSPVPETWLDPAVPDALAVPVLGLHGAVDQVSPLAGVREWFARVPSAELVAIAGGHHDILNDQTHRSVAATIVLFLERVKAAAGLAPIAVPVALRHRREVAP